MQNPERDHILTTKNLYLINNTYITPPLTSQIGKHLSVFDKQKLNKIGKLETDIEQAAAFYALVVTKEGLYKPLIEALETEKQFGPANALRELSEDYLPQPQLQVSNNGGANRLPNPSLQFYLNHPYCNNQNQDKDKDEEPYDLC